MKISCSSSFIFCYPWIKTETIATIAWPFLYSLQGSSIKKKWEILSLNKLWDWGFSPFVHQWSIESLGAEDTARLVTQPLPMAIRVWGAGMCFCNVCTKTQGKQSTESCGMQKKDVSWSLRCCCDQMKGMHPFSPPWSIVSGCSANYFHSFCVLEPQRDTACRSRGAAGQGQQSHDTMCHLSTL